MPDNPLLPCPFCGSPAKITDTKDPDDWEVLGVRLTVQCTGQGCWATIQSWTDQLADAVAAWNRRVLLIGEKKPG